VCFHCWHPISVELHPARADPERPGEPRRYVYRCCQCGEDMQSNVDHESKAAIHGPFLSAVIEVR